jgi:hypothetical protein
VDTANSKSLCPSVKFFCTKDASSSSLGEKSRPDITAFASKNAEIIEELHASNFSHPFEHTALIIKCKRLEEDPFGSSRTLFEKEAASTRRICGQLITYAKRHHEAQPHIFSFHLCLIDNQARIIRWDRTSALVTELFPWDARHYLLQPL